MTRYHARPPRSALFVLAVALTSTALRVVVADARPLAIAVFEFEADRRDLALSGEEVTDLLIAGLATAPGLILVERGRLEDVLSELELGISGAVDPDSAARIGRLIGANALVTGRLFRSGDEVVAVTRTIGTETGRVYAESATIAADEPVDRLAALILDKVSTRLKMSGDTLIASREKEEDRRQRLSLLVRGKTLPTVSVSISERHSGRAGPDPAAETELALVLGELGFRLVDPRSAARADIQITGEAFSEVGARRGRLVSASGRVELRAVDRVTHAVLVADRQTEVALDLSSEMAGRAALQRAAGALSERVVRALMSDR